MAIDVTPLIEPVRWQTYLQILIALIVVIIIVWIFFKIRMCKEGKE